MKKKRLNLSQIKVKTFVTSVATRRQKTVKGGVIEPDSWEMTCGTDEFVCASLNEDCDTVHHRECRNL